MRSEALVVVKLPDAILDPLPEFWLLPSSAQLVLLNSEITNDIDEDAEVGVTVMTRAPAVIPDAQYEQTFELPSSPHKSFVKLSPLSSATFADFPDGMTTETMNVFPACAKSAEGKV
jgi:hypothetical protein